MSWESVRDGFMPWAGLALGTTGYFLAQQIGSDSTFQDCRVGSPMMVTIGAIAGLAVIALGAIGSWRVYAATGNGPARRLVAIVGLLSDVLFTMGVILPFVASMVIPRCWS